MMRPSLLSARAARLGRLSRGRQVLVVGAAASVAAGLGVGAAFGFMVSTGSSTASGAVGSMQTVTLTAVTDTPTTPLVPGGTGDVVVSVDNPNHFGVSVTSLTFESGATITFDAGHGGCSTTDSQAVVSLSVPAGDLPRAVAASTSTTLHLANAVTMDPTATSTCQGATIYIPVVLTVQSSS